MKSILLLIALFSLGCRTVNSTEVVLHQHLSRHTAYEWRIDDSRLEKLPKWNPREGPVPLSLDSVIEKAMKWFAKKGHEGADISAVNLERSTAMQGPAELVGFGYYLVSARTGLFDSMHCLILFNGEVLQPTEIRPEKILPRYKK